jgi:hypothetical protein
MINSDHASESAFRIALISAEGNAGLANNKALALGKALRPLEHTNVGSAEPTGMIVGAGRAHQLRGFAGELTAACRYGHHV